MDESTIAARTFLPPTLLVRKIDHDGHQGHEGEHFKRFLLRALGVRRGEKAVACR